MMSVRVKENTDGKTNPLARWTPADIGSQAEKRVLITGATSGLGFQTALAMARAGAEVTIPARTAQKAEAAAERIRQEAPGAVVRTGVIDLTKLSSVRAFADAQLEDDSPIDVLINNAGVMAIPDRTLSADGYEMQFATNVLGHFLLTGLLLPQMLKGSSPRIVTVSSSAHEMSGPLRLDNLNSEKKYGALKTYMQTKLMNILVARELQRRMGSRLVSTICHPGGAQTNLFSHPQPFLFKLLIKTFWALSKPADVAAWSTLFAATSEQAKPGVYYGPEKNIGKRGAVKQCSMAKQAYDDKAARMLFDRLEQISEVKYPT